MAIVVESSASTGFASSTSVTITKPTGLAEGDMMIAHLGVVGGSTFSTPAGWTLEDSQNVTSTLGDNTHYIYSKLADSSDVAASNFTFTGTGSSRRAGGMLRVSGTGITSQTSSATDTGDTTITTTGLTPTRASSLLVMAIFGGDFTGGSNSDFSGYTVATDDPTWTEQYELDDGIDPFSMALATAIRTETTATGTASITSTGNTGNDYVITLMTLTPQLDQTHSPDSLAPQFVIPTRPTSVSSSFSEPTPTNNSYGYIWTTTSKS